MEIRAGRPQRRWVGVIGDLVASRQALDRRELQDRLTNSLERANSHIRSIDPLTVTVGDEFQGLYSTVNAALAATLVVQLMLGHKNVRFGIGAGPLLLYDRNRSPYHQDGPVWWAARAAIDQLNDKDHHIRTAYVNYLSMPKRRPPSGRKSTASVNGVRWEQLQLPTLEDNLPPLKPQYALEADSLISSLLLDRDALLAHFDERDLVISLRLIDGWTQQAIGDELRMSQPAVSQRISRSGADVLVESFRMLQESAA